MKTPRHDEHVTGRDGAAMAMTAQHTTAPRRHWKDVLVEDLVLLELAAEERCHQLEARIASLRLQRAGLLDYIAALRTERESLRRIVAGLREQVAQLMGVGLPSRRRAA
jgi:uncharacterized sporulation protein YeaH/YhbH (DUF444 family)